MSILENLQKIYEHNCLNCKHLDILPDEPLSTRYDCFHPNFDFGLDKPDGEGDPEYYWQPEKENNCHLFEYKELFTYPALKKHERKQEMLQKQRSKKNTLPDNGRGRRHYPASHIVFTLNELIPEEEKRKQFLDSIAEELIRRQGENSALND